MSKKIFIIFVTIFFIALFVFYLVVKKNNDKEEPFKTILPLHKNLTQIVNASGTLEPEDKITIGSLVAGRVVKIHADDNDLVKKNQFLLTLDDGTGDQAVKRAQARLEEQKANLEYQNKFYQRQQELFKSGQISQDSFDIEKRNFKVAIAKVKQAEQTLIIQQQNFDNLFIKAPEDGIIIARKVDLGQMITSIFQATELFVIAKDLTHMEAHIDVDEADIGLIKIGQEVTFNVDAFPKRTYKAKVTQINYLAKIKESVVTYVVILNVANPDLSLRPGMTTNVDIVVAQGDNVLCIPNRALRINDDLLKKVAQKNGFSIHKDEKNENATTADLVWTLKEKTLKKQKIETGIVTRRYTEIVKGISKTTKIVTEVSRTQELNPLLKRIFGGRGIGNK